MEIKGFTQDKNVDYINETVLSFTRDDGNQDYFVEIVDCQNSDIKLVILYAKCSRIGIWSWDPVFNNKKSLDAFTNEIVAKYMPKDD